MPHWFFADFVAFLARFFARTRASHTGRKGLEESEALKSKADEAAATIKEAKKLIKKLIK